MVSFYRKAENSDFEKAESEFSDLPKEVKDSIISEGKIGSACTTLFRKYGYSMQKARKHCSAYMAYLKAKDDFRRGKDVYTEYDTYKSLY